MDTCDAGGAVLNGGTTGGVGTTYSWRPRVFLVETSFAKASQQTRVRVRLRVRVKVR